MEAIASFREAMGLAKHQAQVLKLAGYRGHILPRRQDMRVELVAMKARAKHAIHVTYHPRGVEAERLPVTSLAEARALIEA
jgi:hypothetical protein